MKRFLFWFVLGLLAILWFRAAHRPAPIHRPVPVHVIARHGHGRVVYVVDRDGRRLVAVDDQGVRVAFDRDRDEEDEADDRAVRRESVEGLPVPVVPGSRVTDARIEPPKPSRVRRDPPPHRVAPASRPTGAQTKPGLLKVTGRLSATEERARNDARAKLEVVLAERLEPEVPRMWKIPSDLVDGMIRGVTVKPLERDYGTVYEATLEADVSPEARADIVAAYRRHQVVKRLGVLGAALLFVLACLAAVSGYIRVDEATKGYYTNRLRLAAAAGLGAAGVLIYQMLRG